MKKLREAVEWFAVGMIFILGVLWGSFMEDVIERDPRLLLSGAMLLVFVAFWVYVVWFTVGLVRMLPYGVNW